jgi:hypothetical protein
VPPASQYWWCLLIESDHSDEFYSCTCYLGGTRDSESSRVREPGNLFQQDFSQNQQNFDLPGCCIDQQIDSQKNFSQNQQNFDLEGRLYFRVNTYNGVIPTRYPIQRADYDTYLSRCHTVKN